MRRSFSLIPALFMLGIAATVIPSTLDAAPPKYKAASPKGGTGWSTSELPDGRYAVSYTGDSKTKKDVVANYAFLRAAEYTDEKGFEWFAVIASSVREVEVGSADDLAGRTGNFIGGGTSAGMGAGSDQSAGTGGSAGSVNMGPSTGGFGGGDVPPQMLERWRAKKVPQAVLIIQMGKGDQANFEGLTKQPEIFDAKATLAELRAEPAK